RSGANRGIRWPWIISWGTLATTWPADTVSGSAMNDCEPWPTLFTPGCSPMRRRRWPMRKTGVETTPTATAERAARMIADSGGRTGFGRMRHLWQQRFGRPLESVMEVLDYL